MFEKGPVVAMHGLPWWYDTHVPIVFIVLGIQPRSVYLRVHPVDVTLTVSAFLEMAPPSAAKMSILTEVMR